MDWSCHYEGWFLVGFVQRLKASHFSTVVGVLAAFGDLPAAATSCGSGVRGDVSANGDGYAEVVIGEPGDSKDRGAAHLLYGYKRGLVVKTTGTALDDQYFTEKTSGVPGVSEVGDRFGASSELGDLNGDGCADLAVGAPGDDQSTGIVTVLYGSSRGDHHHGRSQLHHH